MYKKSVYIAARYKDIEKVKEGYKIAKQHGYEINHDWTNYHHVDEPSKKPSIAKQRADDDIFGATNATVFIMLMDQGGCGMWIELGAAIQSSLTRLTPEVYVVGNITDRSIFFYHSWVTIKPTIEDVFEDLKEVLS